MKCSTGIVVESPQWKSEGKQVTWKHGQGSLPVTCEGCEATKQVAVISVNFQSCLESQSLPNFTGDQ